MVNLSILLCTAAMAINAAQINARLGGNSPAAGFDVTDRIDTVIYAAGAAYEAIEDALSEHGNYVAAQTLSRTLELKDAAQAPAEAATIEWEDGAIKIKVTR